MISIVAKVISLFALFIQRGFLIASFVGKIIVATVAGITNAVLGVFENVLVFFQIVYEDNIRIFSEELPCFVNDAIETFSNQLHYLLDGIVLVNSSFIQKLCAVVGSFKAVINAVLLVICEVLIIFKGATVFIGNTIWLILTFLPVHLPQLLQVGFKFVGNIVIGVIVDAYMALLKFTNFMTDVPLESFIGITSAIIIVRLCVHFRVDIQSKVTDMYWLCVRKITYLYYTLYNYAMDSEVRVITHMASGQDITAQEANLVSNEVDDGGNADTLCIICQERQKCVLTLPCRHVCLCAECCRRLYGYQRTCPICRTFIYHSVTVYL